jgi:outer membrane protein assembly factor BamE (lipoprotein component of BamABCDE complex)
MLPNLPTKEPRMMPETAATVRRPPGRAKRLLRIAAVVLAAVLAGETVLLLARTGRTAFPRPGISRQNAERIRAGMSCKEVEAILGGPAGDYRTGPTAPVGGNVPSPYWLIESEEDYPSWKSDSGTVWVRFDAAGLVEGFPPDMSAAVFYWDSQKVRINPEAFSRIKEGMTWDEVVLLLGGWPGDYRIDPTVWYPGRPEPLAVLDRMEHRRKGPGGKTFWKSDEGCIHVGFTEPFGIVKSKHYWLGKRRQPKHESQEK